MGSGWAIIEVLVGVVESWGRTGDGGGTVAGIISNSVAGDSTLCAKLVLSS